MNEYTIPKPKPSAVLWLLAAILIAGLIALYMAANHAFSLVTQNPAQAVFAALLIEAGMVVDAIAIVRARSVKENWPALVGLVVSLIVSGTYNYIQAQRIGAANGITGTWQLGTLALGPLSALAFLALAVGRELRRYEESLAGWQAGRQARLDDRQRIQAENALQLERQRAEHALRVKQAEIEAQLQAGREQAQRELREKRRMERLERKDREALPAQVESDVNALPETGNTRQAVLEHYRQYPESSQREAARALGVSHTRVGQLLRSLESSGMIQRNGKVVILETQPNGSQ